MIDETSYSDPLVAKVAQGMRDLATQFQATHTTTRDWYRSVVECPRQNCHLLHRDNPVQWCRACLLSLVERARANPAISATVRRIECDSTRSWKPGYWTN